MAPLDRTEKFQIRLTEQEKAMLELVADHEGLSASDLIRQFIRQKATPLMAEKAEAAKRVALVFAKAPKATKKK